MPETRRILGIIQADQQGIVEDWLGQLRSSRNFRQTLTGEQEMRQQCSEFLSSLAASLEKAGPRELDGADWQAVRDKLSELSDAWIQLGFIASELAGFVMLLREPLLDRLAERTKDSPEDLLSTMRVLGRVLDRAGLWAAETFQRRQQQVIQRQQEDLMELSTPVISIWDGILVLPLIGTLDSSRTQIIMESLLQRIVDHGAEVAILDITGVPTVDTLVAQHLLKAVTAARLMGAECIISGIQPSIAQTMVQLGVDLHEVATRANLADAFQMALRGRNLAVCETRGGDA
ncbi:MAG: STAS domain-containing protein [Planctomycetota bacterium]